VRQMPTVVERSRALKLSIKWHGCLPD